MAARNRRGKLHGGIRRERSRFLGRGYAHGRGGDFILSREHGDRVLGLYSEDRHLADIGNTDPKTSIGTFGSLGAWMLGYPDRAVQLSNANDAHVRRRCHPIDLGISLTVGGDVWYFRCEPAPLLARAEEAERLGRAHSLPLISEVLAQIWLAWGSAR